MKPTGVDFEQYALRWLERIQHSRKPSTHDDYRKLLERSIYPSLKGLTVQEVTRERVKALAVQCLGKGQSPKTVQNTVRCLSSLLSHAVEDGLIQSNPATKPGKFLPKISKRHAINPLTREEVATLVAAARSQSHPHFVLLLCAVRSGLRQGELVALEWADLNEVRRSHTHGMTTTPKSGESRRVDMSLELMQAFKDLRTERQSKRQPMIGSRFRNGSFVTGTVGCSITTRSARRSIVFSNRSACAVSGSMTCGIRSPRCYCNKEKVRFT